MPTRVVIYVRGREAEIAEQLQQVEALRQERKYLVVGIARDAPGQTAAWDDAMSMVKRGLAERVIMASACVVPEHLESATGALPGPGILRRAHGAHRRIRPLRRRDGEA